MSAIFCSIVVPTIGRKSLVRTVESILSQGIPSSEYEIIVVNDTGSPMAMPERDHRAPIRVLRTNRVERCFARNSGAAVANGRYIAFLDDDDWLLPGALKHFHDLAIQFPDAAWLYGGIRIVDEQNQTLAEINSGLHGNCFSQFVGGAWAPIQVSMLRTDVFFEVGGFSPSIIGTEDLDLCRQISYQHTFANTRAVIGCLQRGKSWDTSTPYQRATEDTRLSRDRLLSLPRAFSRLRESAGTSYWHGRNFQAYLSSFNWNLKRRRLFTSLSRAFRAALCLLFSGYHLVMPDFWRAALADHVPDSLHFVMKTHYEYRKK